MPRCLSELGLFRHGQTEWNATGRLQGRPGSLLIETGTLGACASAPVFV